MIKHPIFSNLLQFENLKRESKLIHFSTTRHGGASQGSYEAFNLSEFSGDQIENVNNNRKRLLSCFNLSANDLYIPEQCHQDKIIVIDKEFLEEKNKEIQKKLLKNFDAIITSQKNICIGIFTADCVPILIFDPINKVIAAIHAGWRGTVNYIAVKTVEKMKTEFDSKVETLLVGIGPSICYKHFEVGEEVVEEFSKKNFEMAQILVINNQNRKFYINLQKANSWQLLKTGIPQSNIEISDLCTYSHSELFFSARRQGIKSGRMLTGGILF